jgi:hypothetical protein
MDRKINSFCRKIIGRFPSLFTHSKDILRASSLSFSLQDAQDTQLTEIPIGGIIGDAKLLPAPTAGYETLLQNLPDNLLLTVIQLLLNRWRDNLACNPSRNPQSIQILSRAGKNHLKVPTIRCQPRLIKPMVKHLFSHAAEAASPLFNPVKKGQTLGQNRIPRTRFVVARAQFG